MLRLHHYPYDDDKISRDTYTAALSTAANLILIQLFTMIEYTNTEYTNMVLVNGEAAGNARAARHIYQQRYPHRVSSSVNLFAKDIQRLRERGIFTINWVDCGAQRRRCTPNVEEDVLHSVEETLSTSTQTISRGMGVPHSTAWEVLHEEKQHPCHPQRVVAMGPIDFAFRDNFCIWFLRHSVWKNQSFQDKCSSLGSKNAILNSENSHVGMTKTPMPSTSMYSSNVSAFICGKVPWRAI